MKKVLHKLVYVSFITILSLALAVPANAKSPDIPDEEVCYVLMDSKTGRIFAEQNADRQIRPASLTKILTAIVALENADDLQQEMTVSREAVYDIGRGGMNIGIMAGETGLTLENMINVMLIKSANEAANIIAENLAASRREYMDMMNRRARELGAVNTYFVNPSGKDTEKEDADHFSTARDIAIMARHAMTIPEFRKIVATEYYEDMPATNKHDKWDPLRNTNKLLWYDNTYPYTVNGMKYKYTVTGIKTGYTAAAGNNLVISATGEDGMELIAVVMHVMTANKVYGYATELLRFGFENYSMQKLADAGSTVRSVIVEEAAGDDNILDLVTESELCIALPVQSAGSAADNIETRLDIPGVVKAPVEKGDVIGTIEYVSDGTILGKVNLIAARTVYRAPGTMTAMDVESGDAEADQNYSYTLLWILLAASGFVMLRMVLRKISRSLKKKRYEYMYYRGPNG